MDSTLPPLTSAPISPGNLPPVGPPPTPPSSSSAASLPTNKKGEDEAQQAKTLRAQELKRLEAILPKQATDSKIVITRISGPDLKRVSAKPVMTILISDLEEAVQTTGVTSEEYILDRLREKFNSGKFRCQVLDRTGRPVAGIQPFIMSLDEDEESEEESDMSSAESQEKSKEEEDMSAFAVPPTPPTPPTPPPPPAFSGDAFLSSLKREREQETSKQTELLAILTSAQQTNQQMMMMFMQQMQQQQQMMLTAQKTALESAAARSTELWKTALTVLGPVLSSLLHPKESVAEKLVVALLQQQRTLSPEMQVLIEQLKQQNSAAMFKEVLSLQTSAATAAIETQAKLTSTIIDNALAKIQDLASGGEEKESSTLESLAKIAAPLIMSYMQQKSGSDQQLPAAAEQALSQLSEEQLAQLAALANKAQTQSPAHTPSKVIRDETNPPPPKTGEVERSENVGVVSDQQNQPANELTEEQKTKKRLEGCFMTIVRMAAGDIPTEKRWPALKWCIDHAPESLLNAIREGSDEQVIAIYNPLFQEKQQLTVAFSVPGFAEFLQDALIDMRSLLLNELSPEREQEALRQQKEYVESLPAEAKTLYQQLIKSSKNAKKSS